MTDATSRPKPSEPPSQSGPPDTMSQYFQAVRQALGAIEMTQVPVIRQAAERFAATILTGRLVHVFGTGHSRMAVEEMFPRYGSFPGFHPIVELSMSYHNPVVGANGQRQAMFLENVQGFGPVLWRNFSGHAGRRAAGHLQQRLQRRDHRRGDRGQVAGDVRGCPDLTGQRRRLDVAAPVGPKLHEVADLVLDQQAPPGDSAVWIKDLQTQVASLSSITSCTIINLIKAEVARLLTEAGHPPQGPHLRLPSGRRSRPTAFRGNLRRLPPPRGSALSLKVTSRSSPAQTLSRLDAWCRGGRPSGL